MSDSRYGALALYIDGKWLASGSGGIMEIVNPATGAVLGQLPTVTEKELDLALESAAEGFRLWRRTAPAERCAIILAAAKLIRERLEMMAAIMTLEQGKPIGEARMEILRAAELIEWAAEEGRRTYGQTIPAPAGQRYLTYPEPMGVVAALTPWNFPAVSPARKVSSSLAAGCSCILKPSEQTPGTALALVRAFVDAGIPNGVLTLLFGDPARISSHLIASPIVRKISFTGSVPVGKHLAEQAGRHMKPALMELGGHSPTIVFADADISKIAKASAAAKYRNAGQVCTSPTRFYVQAAAYDEFTRIFAESAGQLVLGNGMDQETKVGPLVSARRVSAIESLVQDARDCGAELLAGGARKHGPGNFYAPTALGDVPLNARLMHEEPFGPVAAFRRFENIDEVLEQANSLPYGLAAYLFTGSIKTANAVSGSLECGIVGINSFNGANVETPFGGVKESGYGREGGTEGVREYMTTKLIVEGTL